ncbi:hypothetical protein C3B58_15740 [Lactonifactor longoviformis]|nr:hypothetical protein C3B58_15740 [Lactonifactor longoviformis]
MHSMKAKKLSAILLAFCLGTGGIAGCGTEDKGKTTEKEAESTATQEDNKDNQETEKEENKEEAPKEEKETSSIPAENGKAIIYSPNENADGYNKQEMDFEEVSPGMIIGQMVGDGTLPDSVVVQNFEEVDNEGESALRLDLSSGFGEYVQSMGTAGEDMTMGSLVNTFLDTYGVSSIEILVDGEAFSTGHSEYSGFLSRYE